MMFNAKVNSRPLKVLFDTGAGYTVLNKSVFEALQPACVLYEQDIKLCGVTGAAVKVIGKSVVHFDVGSFASDIPVNVCEDICYDMILGRDNMVHLGEFTVKLQERAITVQLKDGTCHRIQVNAMFQHCAYLKVFDTVIVPPMHFSPVKLKINGQLAGREKSEICVEPRKDFFNRTSLMLPHCLIEKEGQECTVYVASAAASYITLHKNTRVGVATTVEAIEAVMKRDQDSSVNAMQSSPTSKDDQQLFNPDEFLQQFTYGNDNLSEVQIEELKQLLLKHYSAFGHHDFDVGTNTDIQFSIDTGSARPVKKRPYGIPLTQRPKVADILDQMEKQGITRKSWSP